MKALKKIEETKRKAKEIFFLKMKNEAKVKNKHIIKNLF